MASEKGAAPRDNAVFEAGYFIGLKGKRNILIIREAGSKMPADVGRDIYDSLADNGVIPPVKRTLSAFMGAI
jgi:predicted nucleotide-binding protein